MLINSKVNYNYFTENKRRVFLCDPCSKAAREDKKFSALPLWRFRSQPELNHIWVLGCLRAPFLFSPHQSIVTDTSKSLKLLAQRGWLSSSLNTDQHLIQFYLTLIFDLWALQLWKRGSKPCSVLGHKNGLYFYRIPGVWVGGPFQE